MPRRPLRSENSTSPGSARFYRQPARIFWVYGFPTVLAIGLGLAFQSRPPESVQVDLVENAARRRIEKTLERLRGEGRADGDARACCSRSARAEPRPTAGSTTGKTPLVVVPEGVARLRDLPLRPDPARGRRRPRRRSTTSSRRAAGRRTRSRPTTSRSPSPGSRYIDFLIPGLIGLNTMGGGLWGIGFLLVNFRIAKLLKCFVATPMPRRNFLLALLGAAADVPDPRPGASCCSWALAFGMPIRGSLLLVVLVDVLGALAFAGIGLLVASRAATTETVSGLMNLVMLPMWLFSGVFFSSERFPARRPAVHPGPAPDPAHRRPPAW